MDTLAIMVGLVFDLLRVWLPWLVSIVSLFVLGVITYRIMAK